MHHLIASPLHEAVPPRSLPVLPLGSAHGGRTVWGARRVKSSVAEMRGTENERSELRPDLVKLPDKDSNLEPSG